MNNTDRGLIILPVCLFASVTRLERRDGRLVEEPYEVYVPRVLAGIAGLKDTPEDRALPVMMLRKRRAEPVARLEAQGIDDRAVDL